MRTLCLLGWLALFSTGCGGDADVCASAQDHVRQCFPEMAHGTVGSCDEQRAAELLTQSCEVLGLPQAGKADLWGDLLCALGFGSRCSESPAGASESSRRAVSGRILSADGTLPLPTGITVKLTSQSDHEERTALVDTSGGFVAMDVKPERQNVQVIYRTIVLAHAELDVAATSSFYATVVIP